MSLQKILNIQIAVMTTKIIYKKNRILSVKQE